MKDHWTSEARSILKGLVAREDVSYKGLALLLDQAGMPENADQLRNKINRGTFSFAFFLKCLHALGHADIQIKLKNSKQGSQLGKNS